MKVGKGRRSAVRAVSSVLVVLALAVTGLVGSASAATKELILYYAFEPTPGASSSSQPSLGNDGDGAVATSVVTASGGMVTGVASRPRQGRAVRFPAFDPSAYGERAVVKIVNRTTTDALAPGRRNFAWSASFKVDGESAEHTSTSHDNGDNLFQRGLYYDTQFKLDVDKHRPGCRLRGSTGAGGAVRVVAPVTVSANRWYRATCTRSGSKLTITLARFDAYGRVDRSWSRSATSKVGFGSITWRNIHTPVTLGGKLTPSGTLTSSSDQFNGVVDNPQLRIWNP
jgi:hypothetical protein